MLWTEHQRLNRSRSWKDEWNAVFTSTRVPVTHLFDYLEAGATLDSFLTEFSSVTRDQALGVLELMKKRILTEYEAAA
jgi:uncharacterized protein (DUF433 family)